MELPPIYSRAVTGSSSVETSPVTLSPLDKSLAGAQVDAVIQQQVSLSLLEKQALLKMLQAYISEEGALPPTTTPASATRPALFSVADLNIYRARLNVLPASTNSSSSADNIQRLLLTNVLLTPGEKLQAQIKPDGNLQLLTSSPQPSAPAAPTSAPKTPLLQTGLRAYLPYEHIGGNSNRVLQRLWQSLMKLDIKQRSSLIDKPLWQQLSQLQHTAPLQVSATGRLEIKDNVIKALLQNSGHFLEQKLAKMALATIADEEHPTQATTASALPKNVHVPLPTPLLHDSKAQLLMLFQEARPLFSAPSSQTQPLPTLQQILSNAASQLRALEPLLASIGQFRKGTYGGEPEALKQTLGKVIAAAAATGLARISTHQLQHLLASSEPGAPPAPHQVDLSLRIQEQLIPMSLHLQEFPYAVEEDADDASQQHSRKSKKRSRWQIFMQLELEEYGWFAAEIALQDERLSTRFWSEQATIKERAKMRLGNLKSLLESKGLTVDDIHLEAGTPPPRQQPISKSLVDVKT